MVVLEINGTSIPKVSSLIDMMDAQINRMSFEICWSLESVYIVNDKNVPVLIAGKKTVSEELGGVRFEISPLDSMSLRSSHRMPSFLESNSIPRMVTLCAWYLFLG